LLVELLVEFSEIFLKRTQSYQVLKTYPKLPSFEKYFDKKLGSVICYSCVVQVIQLLQVEFGEIFEKRTQSYQVLKTYYTQSYQVLKTYFDQNKAPLFVTQKYNRLKSAMF
jgi:hypothetical protein